MIRFPFFYLAIALLYVAAGLLRVAFDGYFTWFVFG